MSKKKSPPDLYSFTIKLNFVAFLMSLPILVMGIWLMNHCDNFLYKPNLAFGVCLVAVSLATLVVSCFDVSWLRYLYYAMTLFFFIFIGFSIFALVVTDKGEGQVVPARSYEEYRLRDYSKLARNWVSDDKNWSKQKSCLQGDKVCKSLEDSNLTQAQFYKKKLSPIQSGCCKPPTSCGFTYVNATVWNKPNGTSPDLDCNVWSNKQSSLCYGCESCKAGVLANVKKNWYTVAVLNIIFTKFCAFGSFWGSYAFFIHKDNVTPLHEKYPWVF